MLRPVKHVAQLDEFGWTVLLKDSQDLLVFNRPHRELRAVASEGEPHGCCGLNAAGLLKKPPELGSGVCWKLDTCYTHVACLPLAATVKPGALSGLRSL